MITCSLHNHCTLCDGKSTPEEMVRAAFEAGITDFGFSSHAPFENNEADYTLKSEDEYIAVVHKLIRNNVLPINLYLGIENDLHATLARRNDYDYVIEATHHIISGGKNYAVDLSADAQKQCIDEAFGGNWLAFVEAYYQNVLLVAKRSPSILAHFDLVAKYDGAVFDEANEKYKRTALDCLDECLALDTVFEINYGAVARKTSKKPYPAPFIMERIAEKGGRITASTDCHDARYVALGLRDAEEYALSFGIKEITVLRSGKWTTEKIK